MEIQSFNIDQSIKILTNKINLKFVFDQKGSQEQQLFQEAYAFSKSYSSNKAKLVSYLPKIQELSLDLQDPKKQFQSLQKQKLTNAVTSLNLLLKPYNQFREKVDSGLSKLNNIVAQNTANEKNAESIFQIDEALEDKIQIEKIKNEIEFTKQRLKEKKLEMIQLQENLKSVDNIIKENQQKLINNYAHQQEEIKSSFCNYADIKPPQNNEENQFQKEEQIEQKKSSDNLFRIPKNMISQKKRTLIVMYDQNYNISETLHSLEQTIGELAMDINATKVIIFPIRKQKVEGWNQYMNGFSPYYHMDQYLPPAPTYKEFDQFNFNVIHIEKFAKSNILTNWIPTLSTYDMFTAFLRLMFLLYDTKEDHNSQQIVLYCTKGKGTKNLDQIKNQLRRIQNVYDNLIIYYLFLSKQKKRLYNVQKICEQTNESLYFKDKEQILCSYIFDQSCLNCKPGYNYTSWFNNIAISANIYFENKQQEELLYQEKRRKEKEQKFQNFMKQAEEVKDFFQQETLKTINSIQEKGIQSLEKLNNDRLMQVEKQGAKILNDKENQFKENYDEILILQKKIEQLQKQLKSSQQSKQNSSKTVSVPIKDPYSYPQNIEVLKEAITALEVIKKTAEDDYNRYGTVLKQLEMIKVLQNDKKDCEQEAKQLLNILVAN